MNQIALSEEEIVEIVERLIDLTKNGHLKWRDLDDEDYVTNVKDIRYWIDSIEEDGLAPYNFDIRKDQTDGLFVQVVDLRSDDDNVSPVLADRLHRLFVAAKRSAIGIDEISSEIFDGLNSLDPSHYGPDEAPF